MDWQPIETAPKDGTEVLTWGCLHNDGGVDMGENPYVRLSRFIACGWYCPEAGSHEPTHWMPLPAPPQIKTDAPTEQVRLSDSRI